MINSFKAAIVQKTDTLLKVKDAHGTTELELGEQQTLAFCKPKIKHQICINCTYQ